MSCPSSLGLPRGTRRTQLLYLDPQVFLVLSIQVSRLMVSSLSMGLPLDTSRRCPRGLIQGPITGCVPYSFDGSRPLPWRTVLSSLVRDSEGVPALIEDKSTQCRPFGVLSTLYLIRPPKAESLPRFNGDLIYDETKVDCFEISSWTFLV